MKATDLRRKSLRTSLLSRTTILPVLGMVSVAHASNCEGCNFNCPTPADTAGVVRLLAVDVPDTDHVKALLGAINEAYPNITVKIESDRFDVIRDQ